MLWKFNLVRTLQDNGGSVSLTPIGLSLVLHKSSAVTVTVIVSDDFHLNYYYDMKGLLLRNGRLSPLHDFCQVLCFFPSTQTSARAKGGVGWGGDPPTPSLGLLDYTSESETLSSSPSLSLCPPHPLSRSNDMVNRHAMVRWLFVFCDISWPRCLVDTVITPASEGDLLYGSRNDKKQRLSKKDRARSSSGPGHRPPRCGRAHLPLSLHLSVYMSPPPPPIFQGHKQESV